MEQLVVIYRQRNEYRWHIAGNNPLMETDIVTRLMENSTYVEVEDNNLTVYRIIYKDDLNNYVESIESIG